MGGAAAFAGGRPGLRLPQADSRLRAQGLSASCHFCLRPSTSRASRGEKRRAGEHLRDVRLSVKIPREAPAVGGGEGSCPGGFPRMLARAWSTGGPLR